MDNINNNRFGFRWPVYVSRLQWNEWQDDLSAVSWEEKRHAWRTVRCLSFRTLCFTPLVWELTRGSCSSAWAIMNCICGAGSLTPLRCNRWKPRPGKRSNRNKWKGELEHRQQGWGGREKWHQTAQGEQAAVPAGQQLVTWVSLRQDHELSQVHKVYVWPYGSGLQG